MEVVSLKHAKSLMVVKNYSQATDFLETLLSKDHKNIEILSYLSICYTNLGSALEAVAAAVDAVQYSGYEEECIQFLFSTLESVEYTGYLKALEVILMKALKNKYLEGQAVELLKVQLFAKYSVILASDIVELNDDIELMLADPIFYSVIERTITPHHQLEKIIILGRKELLYCIANNLDATKYLPTMNAIACQNLLNDGVYHATQEELALIAALDNSDPYFAHSALVLKVCYADFKQAMELWGNNQELFKSPSLKIIADDLTFYNAILGGVNLSSEGITDKTSLEVQVFYKENPYPKYKVVKLTAMSVSQCMSWLGLNGGKKPQILVAGCGTGLQAIELAFANQDGHITAIDLSPTSIHYAKQMAAKYELNNIEFKILDILNVESLGQQFDYIISTGVLHHMASPQQGLKKLSQTLKPHSLMILGFYSKLGRRQLAKIRQELLSYYNTDNIKKISKESLAKWRASWSDEQKKNHWFSSNDFFNTHGLMDAIFHPQESYYDLPEIQKMLEVAGVEFKSMAMNNLQRSYYNSVSNRFNRKRLANHT